MGQNSTIEWTTHTFNPWMGCTKVAPGCTHCYAEAFTKRYGKAAWGPNGTRVKTSDNYWRQPIKWNRDAEAAGERRRVFCASLADVFEEWTGPIRGSGRDDGELAIDDDRSRQLTMDDLRRDLFALIDQTPNLDWLLLTKRPENVREMWAPTCNRCKGRGWYLKRITDNTPTPCEDCDRKASELGVSLQDGQYARPTNFRFNVWLGCSISEQKTADENIPHLLKCRDLAPVLFLSAEPLLGPLNLHQALCKHFNPDRREQQIGHWCDGPQIQWVIGGGESGPGARPCDVSWIRSIIAQCKAAGVPCFVKQLGANPQYLEWRYKSMMDLKLKDRKGGDPSEWPEDLRVREFPREATA